MIRFPLDRTLAKFAALAGATLAFSFSVAPTMAATLSLTYPDGCTLTGTAPALTLTCSTTPPPPGAPSGCSLQASPSSLPAGGGNVTVTAVCTGGALPITHTLHGGPFEGLVLSQTTTSSVSSSATAVTASVTVTDHATNSAGFATPDPSAGITVASSGGLANCTNQGFSVIPVNGINAPWSTGGTWQSTQSGSFGDKVVWLFTITPPVGTSPSATMGRFAISEFAGPITARQLTISTTPCDFRARDYQGVKGPIGVSNGTTASVIYGVCTPTFFGGNACMTAGTTYYVSARNWQLDPAPQTSCGQSTCNAIMNAQPASP